MRRLDAAADDLKRDPDVKRDEVRLLTVHGAKGLQAPVVFLPDTTAEPRADDRLLCVPSDGPGGDATPLIVWPGRRANEVAAVAERRAALQAKQDVDYRRLLYVALTRAEDRLIVAGWQPRPGADPGPGSWYARVADAMAGLDGVRRTPDGGLVYDLPQRVPAAVETAPDRPVAADAVPPDWVAHPAPPEPQPSKPLAPSAPTEPDPPQASPLTQASPPTQAGVGLAERGRLIHRCLELVPGLPAAEREPAVRSFLQQPAHGLDAATVDAWWTEIAAVLNHADAAPLFGPDSRAEVSVAGVVEGDTVAGRIDRLAVLPDRVLFVDFKTSAPSPDAESPVPEAYRRQMALYARLLRGIFTDRPVEGGLLWTAGPLWQRLDAL